MLIAIMNCLAYWGYSQYASDSNYAFNQGADYFRQYKFDDAIAWFDYSIKSRHNVTSSYVFKAGAEILSGKVREGKTDLDIAFSMDSTIAMMYFYRARQYLATNNVDSALFFLKRAVIIDPKDYNSYDNIAFCYGLKNMVDSAKKYQNEAIRLTNNAPLFVSHLAGYEYQAGEYELSLLHQKLALDMSYKATRQKDPMILNSIAHCDWKLKKYQEALSECEEILKSYPDFSMAYDLEGQINYDLGKKDKACSYFVIVSHIKGTEEFGLKELKAHDCPIENKTPPAGL
jgi:tetratricopeptide (TPR) repeat protein